MYEGSQNHTITAKYILAAQRISDIFALCTLKSS